MTQYLLAIDQGTTSTRAIIFDEKAKAVSSAQIKFAQYFPNNGWVEHDPTEIWQTTVLACRNALFNAKLTGADITAMGISNQRETTIMWDKKTGDPIYPAIVWQDRRTADFCESLLQDKKITTMISEKTGLVIDPYFSATKIAWILDNVENARIRAENGELLFGTIDAFLLWKLTGGKSFYTDITNASRTLLFNIHEKKWDEELITLFRIPKNILPEVKSNDAHFGVTKQSLFDAEIPITGMAGDQQAATIGHACFEPGMIKSTYGTGCFVVLNTGKKAVQSRHRLLTTIAYQINHETHYALEGSIFCAGVGMQWLVDNLKFMHDASESEAIISTVSNTNGVYFVPAFTGLGAPYWDPKARAALLGVTRDTHIPHIVRAVLEAVCYQTVDLIRAINDDFPAPIKMLRVDGGMTRNNWLLQFLADMANLPVSRHICMETSALGAALLAGLGAKVYSGFDEIKKIITAEKTYYPSVSEAERDHHYTGWLEALQRVLT